MEENGEEDEPGGEAAGGKDTLEDAATEADNIVAGGRHSVENVKGGGGGIRMARKLSR